MFFRLERSCAMVTWHRPSWRRLKTQHDFNLMINPEELVTLKLISRQPQYTNDIDGQSATLDEGFLDLGIVKEITMGSRNHEYDADLLAAGRRFGLTHVECCVSILYGHSLSDNRVLCLLCPPMLCRLWYVGLNWIIKGIKRQQKLADRSMLWLKEQYIQLYFEDGGCCEPLAADAIRVFGGRDWANTGVTNIMPQSIGSGSGGGSGISSEASDTIRRETSIKFKKKRSVVNLLSQATGSSSSSSSAAAAAAAAAAVAESGDAVTSILKERDFIKSKQLDRKKERTDSSDQLWNNVYVKNFRVGSITYETQLDFLAFIALFRSFGYGIR